MNKFFKAYIKERVKENIAKKGKGCLVGCDERDTIKEEIKKIIEDKEDNVDKIIDKIFSVIGDVIPSGFYKDIDIWSVQEVSNLGNIVSIKFKRGQDVKEIKMNVYDILKLICKLGEIISKAKEINL